MNTKLQVAAHRRSHRLASRRRGAVSILAMMFLVIFGSLAAAMAIVAQGNLSTADSHLKINRSLAAAETGMQYIMFRLNDAATQVTTRDGVISSANAPTLWEQTRQILQASLAADDHNLASPYFDGTTLHIGPIAVGPGAPRFRATLTPHPILGENYNSSYYQRPPYSAMNVSNSTPLDSTWVRVRVTAADGPAGHEITRAIQMDFKIDKKIRFALLSRSRVMIGRNVMVQGPIGSRFLEVDLENGHPMQMVSDFRGLKPELDALLDSFVATLATNDQNGDNRINLSDPDEYKDIVNPEQYDTDGDGYIDDYDFFLAQYDTAAKGYVTAVDLNTASNIYTRQLLELIDTFGDPNREGYNDGIIDEKDRYAKIRGQVMILSDMQSWLDGAAGGVYQDYFQGSIHPPSGQSPVIFEAGDTSVHQFEPSDFDTSSFANMATGDFAQQAAQQAQQHNPNNPDSPSPLGQQTREEVPYGSAHPYDFYDRPVYENMTFVNVKIPKGTNALFRNCKFIGVTFVETTTENTDSNFNFSGMQEINGAPKYPDMLVTVGGTVVSSTKTVSNNLRFDNCNFEGSIVSNSPPAYTHVRNKLAFTGTTRFEIENSANLTTDQKALFKRSTILTPHYSIEMGSFIAPADPDETVQLSGTIVAGIIDMRGQVKVNGTILTTFEPKSNEGNVIGETSPQFNTTLGYFASEDGDLEGELPNTGMGVVQLRYDPALPLPDGILGPIEVRPVVSTYFETKGD